MHQLPLATVLSTNGPSQLNNVVAVANLEVNYVAALEAIT